MHLKLVFWLKLFLSIYIKTENKNISDKMSKDDVAISGGKTCASKTKSYTCKSKNCVCKITHKFWPPCAQILVELGSKNAHNVLKIILE